MTNDYNTLVHVHCDTLGIDYKSGVCITYTDTDGIKKTWEGHICAVAEIHNNPSADAEYLQISIERFKR